MSGMRGSRPSVGLVLGSSQPPAEIVEAAVAAEKQGFDEIWVGEDYFFTGAIAAAGAVLASTSLPVGIGIVPTVSRHPALLAMEIATLAGIYPGRLSAGVGGGVPDWLDAMALRPAAPLRSVREVLGALDTLLDGRVLETEAPTFSAHSIELEHPPEHIPPLFAGVGGPKALQMSARHASGTVLSVLAGVDYVRWACAQLSEGGADESHRVVVYALCAVADDGAVAREKLRELFALYLLAGPRNPMTEAHGIADEAAALAALDFEEAVAKIPDLWLDTMAVVGTPQDCAQQILALGDAGAHAVELCLVPGPEGSEQIRRIATDVLPLLDPLHASAGI